MALRDRAIIQFPGLVIGSQGIGVSKQNGTWDFHPDYSVLDGTFPPTDNSEIIYLDPGTGNYRRTTIAALASQIIIPQTELPDLPLPYRPTVLYIGDSVTQNNDTGSTVAAGFPNECSRGAEGTFRWLEGLLDLYSVHQYWEPGEADSLGKFTAGQNLAFASNLSSDVHFRLEQALRRWRPQLVIANYGINDLMVQDATGAFTIAYDAKIAALCRKYGAYLVLTSMPPRDVDGSTYPTVISGSGWPDNDPKRAGWNAIHEARTNLALVSGGAMQFINLNSVWTDGAGHWKAGLSKDNVHPSAQGAQVGGEYMLPFILPMITDIGGYQWVRDPTQYNLITGTMNGTGGTAGAGATGQVADGWTVISNGVNLCTATCSKTTLNGRAAQKISFNLSGSAATEQFFLSYNLNLVRPALPDGTPLEFSVYAAWSGNALQMVSPTLTAFDGLVAKYMSHGLKQISPDKYKLKSTGVAGIKLSTNPVRTAANIDGFGMQVLINLTAVGSSGTNEVIITDPIVRPVRNPLFSGTI